MRESILRISILAVLLTVFSLNSNAQFKKDAFQQNYNNPSDTTASKDSIDQMFTFKEFFRGISHKDTTLKIGTMFAGSTVFIGCEQIANRQYWKLPIIYGGLGTTIGLGIHYNSLYKESKSAYEAAYEADPLTTVTVDNHSKNMATYMFASAGFLYWATLMDGVYNFKKDVPRQAGKATIYSILVPGLGQCYNGEYWKVPIYWGGIIGSFHYYQVNLKNYKRYKRIHNEASATDGSYTGKITAETALYYRNLFRRYRDYSLLGIAGVYLLQIIDANVFAYMQNFEMSDDLSLNVSPAVISPYNEYASAGSVGPASGFSFSPNVPAVGSNAYGLRIGITF